MSLAAGRVPLVLSMLCLVVPAAPASEAAGEDEGTFHWSARIRYEGVDVDGFDDRAHATTGRFVLGYRTRAWHDLTALLELEAVEALDPDAYDSTANGETGRPVVADPEDAEINRASVAWHGVPDTVVRLGRQRIIRGNQRFISNVGWRQNEQTYDAFTIVTNPLDKLSVFAARINNVNRVFGEHHPDPARGDIALTGELLDASWQFQPGKLTAYAYWLEFDDDRPSSNRTLGARFAGATSCQCGLDFSYAAEWADQAPHAGGSATNDADYFLVEAGLGKGTWSGALAVEQLGGDGTYAFQTPLALLHGFNGWADLFLVTPAEGLQDRHATVGWKEGDQAAKVVYHDYVSDAGSLDYGDEWGLLYTRTLSERVKAGAKFAKYSADDLGADTEKVWVWFAFAGKE